VRLPRVVLAPIAHQHYLLRQAGIPPAGEALELWPSAADEQRASQLLGESGGPNGAAQPARFVIGMHPGGSGRWRTKRWDLERWAQVCQLLMQRGMHVVVTGGPHERDLGEALTRLVDPPPRLLIGQTNLTELASVIRRCQLFLAHDSAALHVAAAVGTPTVAIFGPTDPRRHLPPAFVGQVIKKDVACSPCYSPRCRTITHACMKRITVEEVLGVCLGLLADAEGAQTSGRGANE
jgi:ADP-heptose:LPS heptosyltransferase